MKLFVALIAVVTLVACEEKSDSAEKTGPKTTDEAPTKTTADEEPAEAKSEPKPGDVRDYEALGDDEWCGVAHEETVKLFEGIKTSLKANDQDNDYSVPAREEYVELCGKLPKPMQKCVVIGYARRHREQCEDAEKALQGEDRKTYQALMGK